MPLQRQSRRPIGIRPVRPGRGAPAGIHEIDRLRDIFRTEHLAQRNEDLLLRRLIILSVDDDGLVGDDGNEEDAAAGEEAFVVEGLPDGVIPTHRGGVEEEFGGGVPEDFVGGKLEEDFGVSGHLEGFDGDALPVGKGRGECDVSGLEDADGEGGDGVVGFDAASVSVGDGDGGIVPGDVGDDGV